MTEQSELAFIHLLLNYMLIHLALGFVKDKPLVRRWLGLALGRLRGTVFSVVSVISANLHDTFKQTDRLYSCYVPAFH